MNDGQQPAFHTADVRSHGMLIKTVIYHTSSSQLHFFQALDKEFIVSEKGDANWTKGNEE